MSTISQVYHKYNTTGAPQLQQRQVPYEHSTSITLPGQFPKYCTSSTLQV